MELDFSRIHFCGRQGELRRLNHSLDQVRGVSNVNSSSGSGTAGSPSTLHNQGSSSTSGESPEDPSHPPQHQQHHPQHRNGATASSPKPCHKIVMIEGAGGTGKSKLAEKFLEEVVEKQTLIRYQQEEILSAGGIPDSNGGFSQQDGGQGGQNGASISSGENEAALPILIGRGKFEESSTMPFASFTECIISLLIDLRNQDPDWVEGLSTDTWREVRRLSSIIPNMREFVGSTRDEAESTIFTGGSGNADSTCGQQWAFERARMALRTLMRTLCSQYTVVLFMDDLQWASEDCIKLIRTIVTDKHATSLLFLGTHRELGPSSPAFVLKSELSSSVLIRIKLGDLNPMDICDILENLLTGRDAEEEDVQGLALAVHSKTGGTIFFVMQFLRVLYERKLITYSLTSFRWEFSLDRIVSETSIYGNVLQLVCNKISNLPKPLQVPLTSAAFLGFSKFSSALLLQIVKNSPIFPVVDESLHPDEEKEQHIELLDVDELNAILDHAVKEGLLDRVRTTKGEVFRFSHDRVREAALALVPQNHHVLQNLHMQIGLELRRIRGDDVLQSDEEDLDRILLHAVRHLNAGVCMANLAVERVELAKLNLEAAKVVMDRSAFPSALEFLQTGLGLLDEETKWRDHYDLSLKLSDNLAHVRFCTGQHDENWDTLNEVLEHGKSTTDKLSVYRTLILSLSTEGRFDEAIERNLSVLDQLGVSLPRNFIKVHMVQCLHRTKRRLKGRTEEECLVYKDKIDEKIRHQCDFLEVLTETCMLSGHDDYRVLSMFRATDYIIENGIEELAPMAVLGIAYQYGLLEEMEKCYKFGKLAAKLAMQGKNPRNDGKCISLAYESPIALKEPYHKCLDSLLTAFKFILDNGEIEHLHLPIHAYSTMYFYSGLRLEPLKNDVLRFVEMLEAFGQSVHLTLYRPFVELIMNLMGSRIESDEIGGRSSISVPKGNSSQAMQYYYRYEMILAFYLDDINGANEMSNKLNPAQVEGPSSWLPPKYFYQGLIQYALCRTTGNNKYRRKGQTYIQKLEKYVKAGNVNCQHLALLLKAEHASLGRSAIDVVQHAYDKAIVSSGKVGFIQDQALGNELAGIYFLARGDRSWASTYLARSHALFQQWGAMAKARQMESKYGELLTFQREEGRTQRHSTFLRGISRAQSIVLSSSNNPRPLSARYQMFPTPEETSSTLSQVFEVDNSQSMPSFGFQQSFG